MSEGMNLSVNGQSQVPPGFRFHPTEEELLHYYLRKKLAYEKIDLDVIPDVDLNKLEPWDIQEICKIGSTPQNDWYFFSHKDKKYPTGTRTNRATAAGFWKATGRDKVIHSSFRRIGMRKTLVFYKGRAPHGQKSDWIMHEYRLDDTAAAATTNSVNSLAVGDSASPEEGWVVCRVFKKKNYHKALESPQSSSTSMDSRTQMRNSSNDGVLDQILDYMGRSCKQEGEAINNINHMQYNLASINTAINGLHDRFTHLPRLESVNNNSPFNEDCATYKAFGQAMEEMLTEPQPSSTNHGNGNGNGNGCNTNTTVDGKKEYGLSDWVTFDRLVASQLNGQDDTSNRVSCYDDTNDNDFCFSVNHDVDAQLSNQRSNRGIIQPSSQVYGGGGSEIDPWNFTRSSSSSPSNPLCHLSV